MSTPSPSQYSDVHPPAKKQRVGRIRKEDTFTSHIDTTNIDVTSTVTVAAMTTPSASTNRTVRQSRLNPQRPSSLYHGVVNWSDVDLSDDGTPTSGSEMTRAAASSVPPLTDAVTPIPSDHAFRKRARGRSGKKRHHHERLNKEMRLALALSAAEAEAANAAHTQTAAATITVSSSPPNTSASSVPVSSAPASSPSASVTAKSNLTPPLTSTSAIARPAVSDDFIDFTSSDDAINSSDSHDELFSPAEPELIKGHRIPKSKGLRTRMGVNGSATFSKDQPHTNNSSTNVNSPARILRRQSSHRKSLKVAERAHRNAQKQRQSEEKAQTDASNSFLKHKHRIGRNKPGTLIFTHSSSPVCTHIDVPLPSLCLFDTECDGPLMSGVKKSKMVHKDEWRILEQQLQLLPQFSKLNESVLPIPYAHSAKAIPPTTVAPLHSSPFNSPSLSISLPSFTILSTLVHIGEQMFTNKGYMNETDNTCWNILEGTATV
jgi:hypothetical protein